MSENEIHVVMLPWAAFGHLIPYLQLSIALAKSRIHVSFLSTPKNILRLPKIPPNLANFIQFIPLQLPKLDSNLLPESAEATVDIPADKIQFLKLAFDNLQEPIRNFLTEKSPDWIIVDFFHHWIIDIAQDLDIPVIRYYAVSATTGAFFSSLLLQAYDDEAFFENQQLLAYNQEGKEKVSAQDWTLPLGSTDFKSRVAYKQHEADRMHPGYFGQNATGVPDALRTIKLFRGCKAVAVRTCPELESDSINLLGKISGKRAFPLGLLPPEKMEPAGEVVKEEPWMGIFKWLDEQKPGSVIFVGFGSECKLSKEQTYEIAYGVELSGLPFLWALRKPDWAEDDSAALPPEFRRRTAGRGVVHVGWAPQREILSHKSVGGSLFHAGWGSIIETLQYGTCLIFLPFIIDQPLNARLLVEKGLGVEVERDENGEFSRIDIAKALKKAMVMEEGEGIRAGAREIGIRVFGNDELHDRYVKKFVDYLRRGDVGED